MATFASRSPAKPARKRTEKSVQTGAMHTGISIPRELVEQRAFEKFLARGCVHGFDVQDWLDAEEELTAEFRERQ